MSTGLSPAPAATSAPAAPTMSEASRAINVFFSPGATFADINRRPSWWLPWLLLSIMAVGFMMVVQQKIGFEQITRNEIAKSSRAEQFDKLSDEQKQQQIDISVKITKVFSYAAPVTNLLVFVAIAGLLMATFNFGMGAEVSFSRALSIVAYGWMPKIVGGILGIISLVVGVDPEGFNIRNPVATNLGYFLNPMEHKFLAGALGAVDVVGLWIVVLIGIGFAKGSKVKTSTAIAVTLVWYLIFNLGMAAISAI